MLASIHSTGFNQILVIGPETALFSICIRARSIRVNLLASDFPNDGAMEQWR